MSASPPLLAASDGSTQARTGDEGKAGGRATATRANPNRGTRYMQQLPARPWVEQAGVTGIRGKRRAVPTCAVALQVQPAVRQESQRGAIEKRVLSGHEENVTTLDKLSSMSKQRLQCLPPSVSLPRSDAPFCHEAKHGQNVSKRWQH
ncbi:unnamed protein product [Ectocarpus sp. 12 AP-2014]